MNSDNLFDSRSSCGTPNIRFDFADPISGLVCLDVNQTNGALVFAVIAEKFDPMLKGRRTCLEPETEP